MTAINGAVMKKTKLLMLLIFMFIFASMNASFLTAQEDNYKDIKNEEIDETQQNNFKQEDLNNIDEPLEIQINNKINGIDNNLIEDQPVEMDIDDTQSNVDMEEDNSHELNNSSSTFNESPENLNEITPYSYISSVDLDYFYKMDCISDVEIPANSIKSNYAPWMINQNYYLQNNEEDRKSVVWERVYDLV